MSEISVIIPTHNRANLLTKHLQLLKEQSLPPDSFEVIVVADGCTDNTAAEVRRLELPYRITFLEQNPTTGASSARNRGAAAAQAGVLLFLDDDMEPCRDLLWAHLRVHRATPGCVVLGYYPMQRPEERESIFTKRTRLWWAERLEARSRPDYRFSFYDLCTGNVSIAKHVFEHAGGFDESMGKLASGEDYELGYRLLRNRVRFYFARDAESVHHSTVSWESELQRVKEDGYGQAVMARKHPELFREFNISRLSRLSESTLLRPAWIALWRFPVISAAPIAVLHGITRLLLAMGFWPWRLHRILKAYAYWTGVKLALGSLYNWERLAQDAPQEFPDCSEVDLDISRDLQNLNEFMHEHSPVDAIRVFADGHPVGRIEPWAPGEALRPPHVRAELVRGFSSVLLGELTNRTTLSATNPCETLEWLSTSGEDRLRQ
jgi:glycosyltransferase involved in cell wall biosynthesis